MTSGHRPPGIRFDQALNTLRPTHVVGTLPATLSALTEDSRDVVAGGGFVALRGSQHDGHRYIPNALAAGARVVICEVAPADCVLADDQALIELPDARAQLPALARAVYGDPSQALKVVAVTGTNGKTTTTWLIETLARNLGRAVGRIGTLGVRYPGFEGTTTNTTPSALQLTRMLRDMVEAGTEWVALEASSHGLVLDRLANVTPDVAIWTHFGRDHLDFHGTLDAYRDAKLRLFDVLMPAAQRAGKDPLALVHAGDTTARQVFHDPMRHVRLNKRLAWYGQPAPEITWPLHYAVIPQQRTLEGVVATLHVDDAPPRTITLPLVGDHNVLNAVAALASCRALGASFPALEVALRDVTPVPGRLERLGGGDRPTVFVDYAHTPDALAAVLETLQPLTRGRLHVVFGAGGDRDRAKRSLMGAAAARGADTMIITNDNPRSEAPEAIAEAILTGVPEAAVADVILDRRVAVQEALRRAAASDVVVIAGKGHETTQEVAGRRFPLDDRVLAEAALRSWRPDMAIQQGQDEVP